MGLAGRRSLPAKNRPHPARLEVQVPVVENVPVVVGVAIGMYDVKVCEVKSVPQFASQLLRSTPLQYDTSRSTVPDMSTYAHSRAGSVPGQALVILISTARLRRSRELTR